MTPDERLDKLARGEEPALVCRLRSGFVQLAPNQFLRGYCLLLAYPKVGQLADLDHSSQLEFLSDMARVGAAIKQVTNCCRLNYAIYGNVDPFLHAHIWPRYEDEPAELRTLPPLNFPAAEREPAEKEFSVGKHGVIQQRLRELLTSEPYNG